MINYVGPLHFHHQGNLTCRLNYSSHHLTMSFSRLICLKNYSLLTVSSVSNQLSDSPYFSDMTVLPKDFHFHLCDHRFNVSLVHGDLCLLHSFNHHLGIKLSLNLSKVTLVALLNLHLFPIFFCIHFSKNQLPFLSEKVSPCIYEDPSVNLLLVVSYPFSFFPSPFLNHRVCPAHILCATSVIIQFLCGF